VATSGHALKPVDQHSAARPSIVWRLKAAGTVPAAKAFIMGVGVAGLRAIATARRLGAQVTATDVRPATKEQVQSLGAKFIFPRFALDGRLGGRP
jgi:H+-translocating NAD(P) transhydrogenase subunit alpha